MSSHSISRSRPCLRSSPRRPSLRPAAPVVPSARRPSCAVTLLALGLLALGSPRSAAQFDAAPPAPPPAASAAPVRILGWNDLGMHCTDPQFSVFSLLPPFNTIRAQVVSAGQLVPPGTLNVTYEAAAASNGALNTTSVGKTDFWLHVNDLFGVTLAPDTGLAGFAMPGAANLPQAMGEPLALPGWQATGIPLTPVTDGLVHDTYPLMRLVARDGMGTLLAQTEIVLPVSDEMDCSTCHAPSAGPAAQPSSGWIDDPDPLRAMRLNVLALHDELQAGSAPFANALAAKGYAPTGLLPTAQGGHAILCAACHRSNALPGLGVAGVSPLTTAIHGLHATVVDPTTTVTLEADADRGACYRCHPGSSTRCLRGAMGHAVAPDGGLAIQCQGCHGSMSAVGSPAREGWLDEPGCQQCHSGTATHNNGQIRYLSVFDPGGSTRVAVDDTFATEAGTLYRESVGHGGLACEACHGSPHAILPSSHPRDNQQALALQGHIGTIAECSACHGNQPDTVAGGPHGMHPVGQAWVKAHGHVAEGGTNACTKCHGSDLRGSVLSRMQGERALQTGFGARTFWRGAQVSCWACHNGPSSESPTKNGAPVMSGAQASTDDATPVVIPLMAIDPNGDALTYRIVEQPAAGTVGLVDGTATYFPALGEPGAWSFSVAAWDGKVDSNLSTVLVSVEDSVCPSTLSEAGHVFTHGGGQGSLLVSLPAGCAWEATFLEPAPWIAITAGASGVGSGALTYVVEPNGGASARSATLVLANRSYLVQQSSLTGPDLAGSWQKLKATCKGDGLGLRCKLRGKLAVSNEGDAKAPASRVRFVLSSDTVLDAGDLLLADKPLPQVKDGRTRKRSFRAKLPLGLSATGLYVLAVLDALDGIAEQDESNDVVVFGPIE